MKLELLMSLLSQEIKSRKIQPNHVTHITARLWTSSLTSTFVVSLVHFFSKTGWQLSGMAVVKNTQVLLNMGSACSMTVMVFFSATTTSAEKCLLKKIIIAPYISFLFFYIVISFLPVVCYHECSFYSEQQAKYQSFKYCKYRGNNSSEGRYNSV